jgi:hypothetical protein
MQDVENLEREVKALQKTLTVLITKMARSGYSPIGSDEGRELLQLLKGG